MKLPVKLAPRYIPPQLSKKKIPIFFSLTMNQQVTENLQDSQTIYNDYPSNHTAAHKCLYVHNLHLIITYHIIIPHYQQFKLIRIRSVSELMNIFMVVHTQVRLRTSHISTI